MATEKGGQTAVLYQWCRAWCNLATAVVQLSLGPAAPQRGIALHHLSDCSPTAMLANRARHPTLTIHPCVGPSPHYYTMRGSRLFSPITLPNTSSNRHHNSISSLSSIKACSSTLHRSINLACFSIGGSDIYPCPLPFLELSAQA